MIFYKASANGNDFILIDHLIDNEKLIKKLCARSFGVGADGLICVLHKDDTYTMRIFNADGSEAAMCGNGLRCVGLYLKEVCNKNNCSIPIKTLSGIKYIIISDENITIEVDIPKFEMHLCGYSCYNAGNKHALKIVDKIDANNLILEASKLVYKKYNMTHIEIIDHAHARILTHEFGVGITNSCGTASLSTYAFLKDNAQVESTVKLYTRGGEVKVFEKENGLNLTGDVKLVYKGEWMDGN